MLQATANEKAYIAQVLDHFKVAMPEATAKERRGVAERTLFRMRLWEVIYQFRISNYRIETVLDAEFVDG